MKSSDSIFKNMSMQLAVAELYDLIEFKQKHSYKTGFGFGFPRWVMSIHLLQHLNSIPQRQHSFTFNEIRSMYKYLAKKGLIQIRQDRSRGMLSYSVNSWGGHDIINDYFIKEINPNSYEAQ